MDAKSNSLAATLIESRQQKLSLSECYAVAQRLANITEVGDDYFLSLLSVSRSLLDYCENEGYRQAQYLLEPAYHCRRHIADALLSMGFFLGKVTDLDSYEKQLLILTMLVHDFGHRGIANQLPGLSHEQESIELLKATSLMTLPPEDVLFIQECILGTMPQNVPVVSREYQKNSLNSFNFMRALVNDADIAASFIPSLGWELSKQILLERGINNPSEEDVSKALNSFKSNACISTLVAREALGLAEH